MVTETEAFTDENGKEIDVQLSNRESVKIVKINKAKVNYFFTL